MNVMPADLIYFDTSYLVRLYLEDRGFERVRRLTDSGAMIGSSWHGRAETVSALHRAFRERTMKRDAFLAVMDQFVSDNVEGMFQWFPLTDGVQQRLEGVYRNASEGVFLRAADALHLASAAEYGFKEVFSNDRRFLIAAPLFGLKGTNVIESG